VPREISRRLSNLPPLRTGSVLALGAILVGILVSNPDDDGGDPPRRAPAPGPVSAKPASSFLERIVPSPARGLPGARVEAVIRRLVARLPVERKAAQLMLVGFRGQDPSATFFRSLKRRDFGGVVFERRNYRDSVQLEAMTASVANATASRGHEPPLMLARQGGGEQSAFPDFPPAGEPGELAGLPDAVDQFADTAEALRAVGMNGLIGPAVDVAPHEAGALGARAFSDDPDEVAEFAKAGVGAFRRAKLLSAVEHFPGIGGATQHTDEGPAQVGLSLEELRERDLVPFRAAIRAGAPAVVVGHGSYATDDFVLPATMSPTLATDVLRGGLGFRGIAISDDLAAGAFVTTQPSVPRSAVEAIRAGVDMVWLSGPPALQAKVYRTILAAIRKGTISRGRLDTALTRIITVKRELGLRVRKRVPPPQYPNAANPGSGQVEPPASGVGVPPPPAPAAPPPVPPAPPAGAP
jgi:beta-N-acetylhexosaminidase